MPALLVVKERDRDACEFSEIQAQYDENLTKTQTSVFFVRYVASYGSNCSIVSSDLDLPTSLSHRTTTNSSSTSSCSTFPLSLSLPHNTAGRQQLSTGSSGVVHPRPQRFTQLHQGLQSPTNKLVAGHESPSKSPPRSMPSSLGSSRLSSRSNSLKRPLPHAQPHHPHEQFFQRHHAQHASVHQSPSIESKPKLRAPLSSHGRSTSPPVKSEVSTTGADTSSAADTLMNLKNIFQHPKKNPKFQPPSSIKSCPVPADIKTRHGSGDFSFPSLFHNSESNVSEKVISRSATPQTSQIVMHPPTHSKTQIFSAPEQHPSIQVPPSHHAPFVSVSGQLSPNASAPSSNFAFPSSIAAPAMIFPGNTGAQSPPPGMLATMATGANGSQQLVFVAASSPSISAPTSSGSTSPPATSLTPALFAAALTAAQQQPITPVQLSQEEYQRFVTLPPEAQQQYLQQQHFKHLHQQAQANAVTLAARQAAIVAVAEQQRLIGATSPDHLVAAASAAQKVLQQQQQQQQAAIAATSQSRRQRCQVACKPCHLSKTACHGGRPCDRCIRRRSESKCVDVKHRKKGRPRKTDRDKDGKISVSPPRSGSSTPVPGSSSPSSKLARSNSPVTIKAERRESTDSDVAPMDMEDMEDDEDVASVSKHRQQQQRSVSPPKLASLLDMSRPRTLNFTSSVFCNRLLCHV